MGPAEAKLQGIRTAKPELMHQRATDWAAAVEALGDILTELDVQEKKVRDTWDGDDAEAALAAFATKRGAVQKYKEKASLSYQAALESAAATEEGLAKLAEVEAVEIPAVPPAPSGEAPDGETAGKAAVEAYDSAKSDHASSSNANAAALDRRENKASQGVTRLDNRLKAAQALLTKTAPPPDDRTHGPSGLDSNGSTSGTPSGAGGSGAGTVVGGTTSVGSVLTSKGGRGGKGGNSTQVARGPVLGTPTGGTGGTSGGEGASSIGEVNTGTVSGGGTAGAAAGAGMLGGGKGILGKLSGASVKAGGAAGSGRTAGMQKGSTLGARGQTAAQSGTRAAASSASGAGQNGGRATSGSGGRTGAGGRGSAGAGTRGGAGTQGGRSAGSRAGSKAGTQGGRGGGRTNAQNKGKNDQSVDHLEFEDDQWLDDDETSPGVIS